MSGKVTLIIRTKNEEKTLRKTLELMSVQTRKPDEILLVDNNSTDNTVNIAKSFGCKIISIHTLKYNHAFACNQGIKNASGQIVVFTNGHSFPVSKRWLESGIKHFQDPEVAGVFGSELFSGHASIYDRIGRYFARIYYPGLHKSHTYDKFSFRVGPGLMATISAAIRKDLWALHPFDEELSGSGAGEDSEWGLYYLKKGYKIIVDPRFAVYHHHTINLWQFLKRNINFYYSYYLAFLKVNAISQQKD